MNFNMDKAVALLRTPWGQASLGIYGMYIHGGPKEGRSGPQDGWASRDGW